jgi:hypothetical protein
VVIHPESYQDDMRAEFPELGGFGSLCLPGLGI